MGIRIVTDSTSDLNEELIGKYNIEIAPLTVHFKDRAYKDTVEISAKMFYEKLKDCNELPKTSQVNPAEFEDIFENILKAKDEVLGIFISSDLSGTFNSAKIAKELIVNDKIHLIDSRNVTVGLGSIILYAAKLIEKGRTIDEIIKEIERIKNNSKLVVMADTLEYLKKGGRLSPAKAMIGTILNLKPILVLKDGLIDTLDKVRGNGKGITYMLEYVKDYIKEDSDIFVLNAASDEAAEKMIEKLKTEYGAKNVHKCDMGPTIGVHLGPGAVGIAILNLDV
ncbi:MAG TPA: DegV family protein [Clostridiales bacterium]|nr:MAG: hypothetical protein A2Y18_06980 [Clostridiales bacterium GWD2_32_19]HCC08011.1 DegV family protein [Clostridiales bacterium]